jgi:hypothetical protein
VLFKEVEDCTGGGPDRCELMSSDDDDEMEILELSEEEEDDIQLIGSGERLSCCFCRGEQCFDTPVEALPKRAA